MALNGVSTGLFPRCNDYRRLASSVISATLARAFDNGQSRFTAAEISWNLAASIPGIVAIMVSAMRSMTKPSPYLVRRTLAVVSTSLVPFATFKG
ncbi:MAG: hypothetical protein IPJ12_10545 [Betaproteobacteria bacterium]|nr:hypothetical protein [Betaproteobacteria bacterium]